MSLLVQKYGGTSVGTIERIKHVAEKVCAARGAGHELVVVVSAMAGETNRLLALAHEISECRTGVKKMSCSHPASKYRRHC